MGPKWLDCYVPNCTSNKVLNPTKVFITVPSDPFIRKKWFNAIGKGSCASEKSLFYACEDHFDLPADAENWITFVEVPGTTIKIKKDVTPHKNLPSTPNKNQKQKSLGKNHEYKWKRIKLEEEFQDVPIEKNQLKIINLNTTDTVGKLKHGAISEKRISRKKQDYVSKTTASVHVQLVDNCKT